MKKYITGFVFLCLLGAIIYIGYNSPKNSLSNKEGTMVEEQKKNPPKGESINKDTKDGKDEIEIKISAVGDILIHQTQLEAQYNSAAKKYDFTNNFKYVKPYIQNADLAIANLETTLSTHEEDYKGYPVFISPDAIVDALKDTGFNLLTAANNHILDGGTSGFYATQEILKEKKIDYVGIKKDKEDKSYIIKNLKGIKVGIANYTFETPRAGGYKTINSQKVDKKIEGLIDSFNNSNLKNDLPKMKERIAQMKKAGAEVIVFCMHWGTEYERNPNSFQKQLAQELSNMGVDIIFAGHPHVLQPIEFIKSQKDNKETLVVYSMGNFISNQRKEILKQSYGEDGIIVNITVKKNLKDSKIALGELSYVPTWVNRYESNNSFVYEIVPVGDGLKNLAKYNLVSEDAKQRVKNSEKNTLEVIEDSSSKLVMAPLLEQ